MEKTFIAIDKDSFKVIEEVPEVPAVAATTKETEFSLASEKADLNMMRSRKNIIELGIKAKTEELDKLAAEITEKELMITKGENAIKEIANETPKVETEKPA